MVKINFDSEILEAVDKKGGNGGPIPEGMYKATVEDYELKQNDRGWSGLMFTIALIGGGVDGRKFWDTITIAHENDEWVKKGKAKLGKMAKAAGLDISDGLDPDQLIGKLVGVKTYNKEEPYNGETRTKTQASFFLDPSEIKGGTTPASKPSTLGFDPKESPQAGDCPF